MMNKKDFESLAVALRLSGASDETVRAVSDACAASNPRFDRMTFRRAAAPRCPRCGGCIPTNENPGAYCGARSRLDSQTEICSACGRAEGAFNLAHPGRPLPPIDQEVA